MYTTVLKPIPPSLFFFFTTYIYIIIVPYHTSPSTPPILLTYFMDHAPLISQSLLTRIAPLTLKPSNQKPLAHNLADPYPPLPYVPL